MWQTGLYIAVFLIEAVVCATVHSRTIKTVSLLLASYVLYITWEPWFLGVLLASTLLNYGVGQWLRRRNDPKVLWVGIVANVALLGFFKYLPPVAPQLPFASMQRFANLALPLGISFWTFQGMSYLFDLYRGEELDPSFAEFALYMAFFPVTISGPVCRMPDMLPQFRSEEVVGWPAWERGFSRIATGVLMMQVSNLLGRGILGGDGITSGFDRLTRWSGPDVWCLAFGYGLQLFFDFAGYSHIAIGAAQALGFAVPENFSRPFASESPSIFWTRWHMSLSFWIRDYVFLPLAVLRREIWWRNLMLVVSMALFGVWHKASILFVAWGLYHGLLLLSHRKIQQARRYFAWNSNQGIWAIAGWLATALLVSLGWILFRSNSGGEAVGMLKAVINPVAYSHHLLDSTLYFLVIAVGIGYAAVLRTTDLLSSREEPQNTRSDLLATMARRRWYWVPTLYAVALLLIVLATHTQGPSTAQFMYRGF